MITALIVFISGCAAGVLAGLTARRINDGRREIYPQWTITGPASFEIEIDQ
jgi:hypothetical protein